MRKKKHFKINPRNRIYDRFYVVNYIEPGKNWEDWEAEKYDSDEDKRNPAEYFYCLMAVHGMTGTSLM